MVTHESTRTFTPLYFHTKCNFLSKRVRQSLCSNHTPLAGRGFSRTMPPTFLFLQYSIVKEPIPQTRYRGPLRFWLRGRQSVAHAALLEFDKGRLRSELLGRQRRAALVGEAYIVGASPKCQHRFRCFLNFLRHVREGAVQPGYVGSEAPFQLSLIGDGDRGPSIQAPAQLRPHSQTKPGTRIRRGSGSGASGS